jgi:hypothetical protein
MSFSSGVTELVILKDYTRRKPGWTDCNFVLPRVSLEGLRLLAITSALGERQLAASEPLGYRGRYPKSKNFLLCRL